MVVKSKAAKAADDFATKAGGIPVLIQWLEAVEDDPTLPTVIHNVLAIARRTPHKKLSRILAETGASHGQLVKWALAGAALAGDAEAAIELRQGQGKAIQNLLRIAHSKPGACEKCKGKGSTGAREDGEPIVCEDCEGSGKVGEHPEVMSAIRLVTEATKMVSSGKGDINVGVGVRVDAGGTVASKFFEKQMEVMERVMSAPARREIVDAEIVQETKALTEGGLEGVDLGAGKSALQVLDN